MHEFKSGVTHTKAGPRQTLSKDRTTIAERLREQGYATALFNKWHLGAPSPDKRGFDLFVQMRSPPPRSTMMYWDPTVVINGKPQGETVKGFSPDILTDQVIKTMEEHVGKDSAHPFCYFFWTITPHAPVMAPEKYLKRFRGKMTKEEAAYFCMVENIDDNVGRVMAKLKELNIDENTLVILMNDNGGTVGIELYNAHMRGTKASVWPGGTRAFSYWRWPGTLTPRTEEALTGYIDVAPTLAEIAGVEFPKEVADELDGHSLLRLLKSPDGDFPRDRLLFKHAARWGSGFAEQHKYIQAAVHQGDHMAVRIDTSCRCKEGVCVRARAVKKGKSTSMVYTSTKESADFHWAHTDGWELYNVKEDPACKNNLADRQSEQITFLSDAYENWWDDVYPKLLERGGDEPLESNTAH
jgi:arylsulfatase A-like enzyme